MINNELLKNFFLSNNYSEDTKKNFKVVLNQYSRYFNMTLKELLEEAEEDENKGTKWKFCRLKSKLLEFRQHLIQKNYAVSTVKAKMKNVIRFYRFYDVEVHSLPKINENSLRKSAPVYFNDLPDKEVIREALSIARPLMKAIILFICSSGCGRAETLSITVQDYIDALSEYLPNKKMDIYEIIDYLQDNDNVVPTFKIRRIKTNKYYTTYCSPEAVKAINAYLLTRKDRVAPESQLFRIFETYFSESFYQINETLGLGKVGPYNRFRSHMLRKFHASALYNDGMSLDKVNDLQGKAKNKTDQAYFMTNPEDLKYDYIQHLAAVTISKDVEKLSVKSPEFVQMENENQSLKSEVGVMRKELDEMKELKKEFYGIIEKAKGK